MPPAAPRPARHGSLLDGVKVVNIGVLDFAEALWAQDVACVHVAWSPPSPEDAELADLLNRML